MRLTLPVHLAFVLSLVLVSGVVEAQRGEVGEELRDVTFPTFLNGDGRQKLSEFRGDVVLIVTFADVHGGMGAAHRALPLHRELGGKGLVVIMTQVRAGGTRGNGADGMKLDEWAMNRCPGWDVRMCGEVRPTWNWTGIGMPPFWAVIGADGKLAAVGSTRARPKLLDEAVKAALKRRKKGWGGKDASALRATAYGKGRLGQAFAKASGTLARELGAVYDRRVNGISWLLEQGEWARAQTATKDLATRVKGASDWEEKVASLADRFRTEEGKRELALDKKLRRILAPLQRKKPTRGVQQALERFAKRAGESAVGRRAARLAEQVGRAVSKG